MKIAIGQKIGMTQIFGEDKQVIPVTLVNVVKNRIAQIKSVSTDRYSALQLSRCAKKRNSKPIIGHLKKAGIDQSVKLKEFRIKNIPEKIKLGDEISILNFQKNDRVNVSGISKGKGFSGTVKRYHFKIGPKSHGSNNQRRPGSIGATTPAHVIKGRRMPGRMGGERISLKNILVVDVLENTNTLLLKGSVPGPNQSLIYISGE